MSVFDRFRKKPDVADKPPLDVAPPEDVAPPPTAPEPPKKGLFARLTSGLSKTKQLLNTDIRDLFKREGRLVDDAFLDELFAKLIRTDIGPAATKATVGEVRANFLSRIAHMEEVVATLKTKFKSLLAQEQVVLNYAAAGPTVFMVCGVNGSGKTTTIAKLTHYFMSQDRSVLLGAGDTFRAAAVEQLSIWAS